MKWNRWISGLALSAALLALPAQAVDYDFKTNAPQDYYRSSSYEDIYGSQYNYGGRNLVDYKSPGCWDVHLRGQDCLRLQGRRVGRYHS